MRGRRESLYAGDKFGALVRILEYRRPDSFLDNWVEPKDEIRLPFKNFNSVQVWAWDSTGALVDSCSADLEEDK